MADTLIPTAAPYDLDRPFPTDAATWTVIDGETAIVAGRVPSVSFGRRLEARAANVDGLDRVLSDLVVDETALPELGALVLVDPLVFAPDSSALELESAEALDALAGMLWQFDEILVWAVAGADHVRFEADAVELSRLRVATIVSYLEFRSIHDVDVRVQLRNRGLVDARGAASLRPAERRLEIRIRRGHEG